MAWRKTSEELAQRHADFASHFAAEKRKIFGCQVYFINDNMFTGVFEEGITLRLSAQDKVKIIQENDEVVAFTPMGREMREYVWLPESLLAQEDFVSRWMDISFHYTNALPPKKAKKPKNIE